MYCFAVIGEDGDEGIPAFNGTGGMMMPMVGADMARVESFKAMADQLVAAGQLPPYRIYHFKNREDITDKVGKADECTKNGTTS